MPKGNCQFKGQGGQYFATVIIHLFLITFITCGIYWAWAWVKLLKLKASHTIMNGKPVTFNGAGGQLLVIFLIQGLLTIITLGLYAPWAICKYYQWRLQNTLVGGKRCQFRGTGGSLFSFYLIHMMILPILTLGIYSFYGFYRLYAWKEEHSKYGGEKTSFGAGFGGFLKVSLIGYILNIITMSIFTPWSMCMLFRWQIDGLAVGDGEEVEHFPPVKTNKIAVAVLIIAALLPLLALVLFIKSQHENFQKIKSQMPMPKPPPRLIQKPPKKPDVKAPAKPPTPLSTPQTKEKPVPKEVVDYELEMKRLNNLINLDDKNADAYYNRGWIYEYKGDLQMAEKDYSHAIEINKTHGDAYYNRGLVLAKSKKYEQAVKDFAEVIKLNPADIDARCNRGNAYLQLGKRDLALEDYNAALKIDPNDADSYYNRGVLYLDGGEKTKAMADFQKATQLGHKRAGKYLKP